MAVATAFGQAVGPLMNSPQHTEAPVVQPVTFDVVSVKRNRSGEANSRMNMTPDGIQLLNVAPAMVIREAYLLDYNEQLQNAPEWTISERYDIVAKVDGNDVSKFHALKFDQVREMLRPVLAERFRLSVHSEMKELPVYDLVVSKGGAKFESAGPLNKKYPDGNLDRGSTYIRMQGLPLGSLVFALKRQLGRSVVDKTGLTGRYDLSLRWTPEERAAPMANGPDGTPQGMAQTPDSSATSIFTAIQEQLGLRLAPSTGPVECIFIDHVERPSED